MKVWEAVRRFFLNDKNSRHARDKHARIDEDRIIEDIRKQERDLSQKRDKVEEFLSRIKASGHV